MGVIYFTGVFDGDRDEGDDGNDGDNDWYDDGDGNDALHL